MPLSEMRIGFGSLQTQQQFVAKECFDRLLTRAEAERMDSSAEFGTCEEATSRSVTLAEGNHLTLGVGTHCWQGSASQRMCICSHSR